MLGKLLKYELPAMGRRLLPLYGAWAAASILLGFSLRIVDSKSDLFAVLTILLYVAVTVAVLVMSIIIVVQRYKKSMLGNEAYFNMTLPVSMNEHLANKTISAMIWMTASALASLISIILILLCSGAFIEVFVDGWREFYREVIKQIGPKSLLIFIEVLILGILSAAKSVLAIYAALTIGHQAKDHTTLASIGAYIGLTMAESTVGNIFIRAGMVFNMGFEDFVQFLASHEFLTSQLVVLIMLLVVIGLIAAYFFICKYFMEKKLNLP